jgi:glutaconyl-CoA/methylmalonyl-CoA decarboxylase subunit gamma
MKMHVKIDDQIFVVEVGNLTDRPIQVTVDGDSFEVWPEEAGFQSLPVSPVPLPSAFVPPEVTGPVVDRTKSVLAPIPGVILTVSVKPGDMVEFGQELCVLEAMKMKNQIRANRAGKIGEVCVSAGEQVRHNQVLFEYAD